jgi:SAM-dependent methyltransferase
MQVTPNIALAQEELAEQDELADQTTSSGIDLDEFYRQAAEPVASRYSGQLEPEFQSALKERHADLKLADCSFYHTMDLPGGDHVEGEWDLRGREDVYLGHYNFRGKRALELGPASGHLTFFMEKSGASVVSFDLPFNGSPALVPTPGLDVESAMESGREGFRRLRNSWWYAHSRYGSRAKVVYGDIENIPSDVGRFDVSVFAAILVHLPDPFAALKQAAAVTDDAIIVVEPRVPLFDQNVPLLYFNPPGPMPARAVYWWGITRTAIQNMLTGLGFPAITITTHIQKRRDHVTGRLVDIPWFTLVARRSGPAGITIDSDEVPDDVTPGPHAAAAEPIEAVEPLALEEFSQPLPPPHLRALVSGTEDAEVFTELGKRGFEAIHDLLVANRVKIADLGSILDFGCGVGRVIRYWRKWPSLRVQGTDINPLLIDWCKENLLFAKFSTNTLFPTLDFPNQSFGLIYALSVFTHLPVEAQVPWWRELLRMLKPGGYLYITLHGLKCLSYLDQEGRTAFLNGDLVVRGSEAEGTNICAAFHPPSYVRENFAKPFGLSLINFAPGGAAGNPPQDSYLLRKPVTP